MRVCPAREGKGACACSLNRFPTSGFGRRSERHIGAMKGEASIVPKFEKGKAMLTLIISASLATVFPTSRPITVFGIGGESCASAWRRDHQAESYVWLMGFWSAANLARGSDGPIESDGDGVAAEVQKTCESAPSMRLIDAAHLTYSQLVRSAHRQ